MIAIALLSFGIGIALFVGLAYVLDRAGVAPDASDSLGVLFVAPKQSKRAPGVQEDDLPRFQFRSDAPVAC
jgi:hypothetical protein